MPALSLAHTIRFLATKPCSRPAHVSSNRCRQSMNTNRMVPSLECAFAQPRKVDRNEVNSASDISLSFSRCLAAWRPKRISRVLSGCNASSNLHITDGSKRPLSILCLEDKVVQQAVATVLEAIYEEDFLGFSYGFRPGRGQHDALDALHAGILGRRREFFVTDLAEAGHIAVNADIEGWVGQDQIGSLAFEQLGVIFVGAGVPAQQPVRAKDPEIALSRNRRRNDSRNMIFRTGFDRLLLGRIVKDR